MTERSRTVALLPAIVAVLFLVAAASPARAEEETEPPPPRHLDLEVGAGAHFGLEADVPLTDDLYTGIGLAAPISDRFDGEVQLAYFTGREANQIPQGTSQGRARDGIHFNSGFRFYPGRDPNARTRFYLSLGGSFLTDYRRNEDITAGVTVGPGIRLRVGKQSGVLVRAPVFLAIEGGLDPLLLPTFNFFYQF